MNGNRYLITGGAGFIGSNFVRYVFNNEKNARITVLDKLSYSSNIENLEEFKNNPNFEFIKGDICDPVIVKKAMKHCTIVVNFAAEVAVDRSIDDQQSFLKTDILGVHVLLENARTLTNLRRFIQISTDEVYGQILEGSFSETDELRPRNPYSGSKCGGDRLAYSYYSTYQLPVIVTRASNTYGPYAYPEKVIPLFITNLVDGHKVPVFGTGNQVRDWLHVQDHCSGIYTVIHKGKDGEVYNIGGDQEFSNIELTKSILQIMEKDESYIKYVNDRPGHDLRYSLITEKLRSLGWKPQYNLTEGLQDTYEWYRDNESWWRPLKEGLDKRYIHGFWGDKDKEN